ncbi:MAG TPA: cyclic nucleotide-binding domain-containing protein [Polyangium sp.]|nr:cyclic nucleotide-binding domain-containing protein [Polyangium sp.]
MEKQSLARSLKEHSLVQGLLDGHIEFLSGCARNMRITPGRFLFREGNSADELYLVRSGKIALEVHDGVRGEVVLETVGANDTLGWAALNPPYRWSVDARAVEPTLLFAINGACVRQKLEGDHSFGYAFTKRLMNEIHERLERVRLQALDVYRVGS